ncbi:hypothetical protein F2Q69_00008339 [Brassica cretica]|uniref:Uncharacterized protein n=1 Tax=Brassica cretica TaxID=69181 RepID=A0A8S9NP26_BRACR|nr:hypothetical protein F2Q69_00008339 [Brassica cretica]
MAGSLSLGQGADLKCQCVICLFFSAMETCLDFVHRCTRFAGGVRFTTCAILGDLSIRCLILAFAGAWSRVLLSDRLGCCLESLPQAVFSETLS